VIERSAWVQDRRGRERATAELNRLVGRHVRRVRYFEIDYSEGPSWPGPDFHTLDFGFELDVIEPDETWSWIWKQAGENEGLLVYDAPVRGDQLVAGSEYGIWDVSESPEWQPVLDQRIAAVDLVWTRGGSDVWCVLTTTLRFDGGAEIVVTPGTRTEDGGFIGSADDVSVFFSRASAERHGVPVSRCPAEFCVTGPQMRFDTPLTTAP
jgi:hypothetical protein